ncbi:Protein hir1 [Dictyocoela muelleri]|nr:Protein hir1 [Dictyocoela muelleri]
MKIYETEIYHGSLTRRKPIFSITSHNEIIATGSIDGELRVWKNLLPFQELKGHSGAVMCLRFNKNGKILISASDDGKICIYKKKIFFEPFKTISAHKSDITALVFSDNFLISGSLDGNVFIFDNKTFKKIRELKVEPVKGVALSGDSEVLAVQTETKLYIYVNFSLIKIINCIFEGEVKECFFSRLSWSPDSKYLAVGLSFNNFENSVEIINRQNYESAYSLIGHVAPVEVVAFSPHIFNKDNVNYYIIATASQDKSLSLWCSQNTYPPLLLKNFSNQPILDLHWAGTTLITSSYDGFVKIVEFKDELGNIGGNICDEEITIPFSLLNIEFSKFRENFLKEIDEKLKSDVCYSSPPISIHKKEEPSVIYDSVIKNQKNNDGINNINDINSVNNDINSVNNDNNDINNINDINNVIDINDINNINIINNINNINIINDINDINSVNDINNVNDINTVNNDDINNVKNFNNDLSTQTSFENLKIKSTENTTKTKKEKKRIKPILIENPEDKEIVESKINSYYVLFKSTSQKTTYKKFIEFRKTINEFKIEVDNKLNLIRVYRSNHQLYTIKCFSISSFCANKDYLVINSNKNNISEIFIYKLESGVLIFPTLCLSTVIAIDIKDIYLLLVDVNKQFRIINLIKRKIKVQDYILDGTLLNIYFDKKYFLISVYENLKSDENLKNDDNLKDNENLKNDGNYNGDKNIYFYNLNLKMWINKNRKFNSRFTDETDFEVSDDENEYFDCDLEDLEHKFQVSYLIHDIKGMLNVVRKIVKISTTTNFTEIDEYKFEHIFDILISLGLKRDAILFLEELNSNNKIQPFICHMIRKIKDIK